MKIEDIIKTIYVSTPNGMFNYLEVNHDEEGINVVIPRTKNISHITYRTALEYDEKIQNDIKQYHNIDIKVLTKSKLYDMYKEGKLNIIIDNIKTESLRNRVSKLSRYHKFLYNKLGYLRPNKTSDIRNIIRNSSSMIAADTRLSTADFIIASPDLCNILIEDNALVIEPNEDILGNSYLIGSIWNIKVIRHNGLDGIAGYLGRVNKSNDTALILSEYIGDINDDDSQRYPYIEELETMCEDGKKNILTLISRFVVFNMPNSEKNYMYVNFDDRRFPLIRYIYDKYFKSKL